jgi:hypothetical protein
MLSDVGPILCSGTPLLPPPGAAGFAEPKRLRLLL